MSSVLQRNKRLFAAALVSLPALMAGPLAHAEELVLGEFSIGSVVTDLNGFRLDHEPEADANWVLGARLTDQVGANSGRAILDVGRPDSGMRFSFGVQLDWEAAAIAGPASRSQPFSFGSEQSGQASPYVGMGYVGRISDRFEITLDAGASYLGSDDPDALSPSIELDRNGSLYGWSPTISLTGRVRF